LNPADFATRLRKNPFDKAAVIRHKTTAFNAMADNDKSCVVGVDLGGTKILAGVFDDRLNCLARSKLSTKAPRGVDAVVARIARCVRDSVDECDLALKNVRAVGIGAPGASNPETGTVLFAPNLPGWADVPLKKLLEKELDVPVFIENDCNIQALGVYEKELKGKPRHMVGIFLGTGIGAGLIFDGKLYSGFNRTAGEIGHIVLEVGGPKCGCGNKGCFEALASRTAIFKRIQAGVKDGQKTLLTEMLGTSLDDMRSGDLRKAIKRGDKFVEKIVEEAAEYTGIVVANIINLLNPEVIVIGGGVMDALEDEMLAIIVETAHDYAMEGTAKDIEIIASKLGDDAGITGGAVLARRNSK
jgi:glucokinase